MSTLAIQGSVVSLPRGEVFAAIDLRVPCDPPPSSRSVTISGDDPVAVALDGLVVNVVQIAADAPVVVVVTSDAGTSQSIPCESLILVSRAVAITAISLVRVAGQVTTVRLILGQEA